MAVAPQSIPRLLVGSFAGAILIGALLLMLPGMVRPGVAAHSFSDALFQATSAVCVTGLSVRDLVGYTWLGQAVILLLMQVGGLGIMTFSKLALLAHGKRLNLGERELLDATHGHLRWVTPRDVLRQTVVYTALCEGIGILALWPRFAQDAGALDGLWLAVFHGVSAFCNAGFALWSDSLSRFRDDGWINSVVMGLVIAGTLGFVVVADLWNWLLGRRRRERPMLNLHTKVALAATMVALIAGFGLFVAIESRNPAPGGSHGDLVPSMFLSVAARTAGFNTVDITQLTNPSLLMMMVLMLIGGSPGSTAGGIKTTTVATLLAVARARATGRTEAELFGRALSADLVGRAVATAGAFLVVVAVATAALELAQSGATPHAQVRVSFLDHLFEVISALCTVGLSTGVTAQLTEPGRVIIELCMFLGRLGPLLVASAAIGRGRRLAYALPREDVLIG